MKYFCIIGTSGIGKSTLGQNLEKFFPEKFVKTIQYTTREKRNGEKEGIDYYFVSEQTIKNYNQNGELFEIVQYQFLPTIYGGKKEHLEEEKWNVEILCIEGILTLLKERMLGEKNDEIIILHLIGDTELDITREGRDILKEQNCNLAVLRPLFKDANPFNANYNEILFSDFKKIRNNKEKLKEYLKSIDEKIFK